MAWIWAIIVGFFVGLIARFLMPGKDPKGFLSPHLSESWDRFLRIGLDVQWDSILMVNLSDFLPLSLVRCCSWALFASSAANNYLARPLLRMVKITS